MRSKIYFPEQASETFEEVFASFIISQTSRGVSAVTIRNYHSHLKGIAKHLDIGMPFCSLSKRHLESMVVSMRTAGLAHNTVATYLRVINTFLNWANICQHPQHQRERHSKGNIHRCGTADLTEKV